MDSPILKKMFRALQRLDAKYQELLSLRYGLGSGRPASLRETARELGTTVKSIDSLEANALRALMGYKKKKSGGGSGPPLPN